jgi:hypothetical protein
MDKTVLEAGTGTRIRNGAERKGNKRGQTQHSQAPKEVA